MYSKAPDALIDSMVANMDEQKTPDKKWAAFLLLFGLSYLYMYRIMRARVPKGSQISIKQAMKSAYRVKFIEINKRIAHWRKHYQEKVKSKQLSQAIAKTKFARMRYLILRSETNNMLNRTLEKSFISLGIKKYKYQTQQDNRVRCSHQKRQGRKYKIGHKFDDGLIGQAYGCRCYMVSPGT